MIDAVRDTARRLDSWPDTVEIQGPLAAFYDLRTREDKKKFNRALSSGDLRRVSIDPETGAATFEKASPPNRLVKPHTNGSPERPDDNPGESSSTLGEFVAAMGKQHVMTTREERKKLAGKIDLISKEGPSLARLVRRLEETRRPDATWEKEETRRLLAAVDATANFVVRWGAFYRWDGDSPFDYFYLTNHKDRGSFGVGLVRNKTRKKTIRFHGKTALFLDF